MYNASPFSHSDTRHVLSRLLIRRGSPYGHVIVFIGYEKTGVTAGQIKNCPAAKRRTVCNHIRGRRFVSGGLVRNRDAFELTGELSGDQNGRNGLGIIDVTFHHHAAQLINIHLFNINGLALIGIRFSRSKLSAQIQIEFFF